MPRKVSGCTSTALASRRPVQKSFSIARGSSLVETHAVSCQEERDDADWMSISSSSVEQMRQTAGSVSFLDGAKPSLCELSFRNKINWDLSDEEQEFLPVQASTPKKKGTSTKCRTLVFCDSYNEEDITTSNTSDLSDEEREFLPVQASIPIKKKTSTKDRTLVFCDSYNEDIPTSKTSDLSDEEQEFLPFQAPIPKEKETCTKDRTFAFCTSYREEDTTAARLPGDESKKLLEYGRELQDLHLGEKRATSSLKDLSDEELEFLPIQTSTPKEMEPYTKDRIFAFCTSYNEEDITTSKASGPGKSMDSSGKSMKYGRELQDLHLFEKRSTSNLKEQEVMQNYNKALRKYLNDSKKTDEAKELQSQDTIERNEVERKQPKIARSKSSKNLEKYDGDKQSGPHLEETSFLLEVVNEDLNSQKKQSKKTDRREVTRSDYKSVGISKETLLQKYQRKMAKVPICDIITTKCSFP